MKPPAEAPGPGRPAAPGEEKGGAKGGRAKAGQPAEAAERLGLPAIGLEAEFALFLDDREVRPEDVFGDPRALLHVPLMHRVGTSYHVPTGGAVYFDTGVIEIATPAIEIERGCAARAGRALWESLLLVREALDAWELRERRRARLVGFSTHYNVSFDPPGGDRSVEKLAWLLAHVLPAPVMLLAANRRSTGVGVRPRGTRIEVTVDFTPSPALMIATATVVTGIVRGAMRWRRYELDELERRGVPRIEDFRPVAHTSRQGWLARRECYAADPFACDIDRPGWRTTEGKELTLRQVAWHVAWSFWPSIRRVGDPLTLQLVRRVLRGDAPSLLDLPDRPEAYEDAGRLCTWGNLFPPALLRRSRYERVVARAIRGERLRLDGRWWIPVGMRGWSHVVFRPQEGGPTRAVPLDALVRHLEAWER